MISSVVLTGLLRALSVLAGTAKFKEGDVVSRVLALAAFALERGEAGRHALELLCARVDEMVAQGRAPTDLEWAELRARSDVAHAQIQAAAGIEEPVPEPDKPAEPDSKGDGDLPLKKGKVK